jgi:hypothetical protein
MVIVPDVVGAMLMVWADEVELPTVTVPVDAPLAMLTVEAVPPTVMVPDVVGAMLIVCALELLLPTVTVPVDAPLAMLTVEAVPPTVMVPDVVGAILTVCEAAGPTFLPILIRPVEAPAPISMEDMGAVVAGPIVIYDVDPPIAITPEVLWPILIGCEDGAGLLLPSVIAAVEVEPLATFMVEVGPPTVIIPDEEAPILISCDVGVTAFAPIFSFPVAPVPVGELEAILTCVTAPPKL